MDIIGSGAAASAACTAIDASRSLLDDLQASAQDFLEGKVEDPVTEAVEIFNMASRVLEEGSIANMVHSLRFTGNVFTLCNLSKFACAFSFVKDFEKYFFRETFHGAEESDG